MWTLMKTVVAAALACLAVTVGGIGAQAATESVIYTFPGGTDGFQPSGSFIADARGRLYGVTENGGNGVVGQGNGNGTVFTLFPAGSSATGWGERVLYRFRARNDGSNPVGALAFDATGSLYGVTSAGGKGVVAGGSAGKGVVFRLSPPLLGKVSWTESVLYQFAGGTDGQTPAAGLTIDANGNLFGTTTEGGVGTAPGNGTVFMLSPPAGGQTAWTETVLYRFQGGNDGATPNVELVPDASGALYGVTASGGGKDYGTVFKLAPPATGQTAWTEQVLYRFDGGPGGAYPIGKLAMSSSGDLFGAASGGGSPTCEANGTGALAGCGVVFRLKAPGPGLTNWTHSTLWTFTGYPNDARSPNGVVIGGTGRLFGTSAWGGNSGCSSSIANIGCGAAFELTAPEKGAAGWTYTPLWSFSSADDGWLPSTNLFYLNRKLYGAAVSGVCGSGLCPSIAIRIAP
jgi:hypothetical protein